MYTLGVLMVKPTCYWQKREGDKFTRELNGVLEPSWRNPKGIRGRRFAWFCEKVRRTTCMVQSCGSSIKTVQIRLGDVVEVVGFHKGSPKLNFLCRRKSILTVNIDKNIEKYLQLMVDRGSQILNKAKAELIDLTIIKGEVEDKVLRPCYIEMNKTFTDHGYVVSTKTNSIGPLELCVLEGGTFNKILNTFIANGAALSQFKNPRCTNNHVLLKILNNPTTRKSTTPLLTKSPKTANPNPNPNHIHLFLLNLLNPNPNLNPNKQNHHIAIVRR
ncbi:hypothetical protein Fmac_026775 [Flemingia macrophylla]|uniref:GH3 C-terminal domain-containing protein n=1 Tax=Flemingia macrophylla TaxID=520843 RepID=A0ABD1LFZ1_9FABA